MIARRALSVVINSYLIFSNILRLNKERKDYHEEEEKKELTYGTNIKPCSLRYFFPTKPPKCFYIEDGNIDTAFAKLPRLRSRGPTTAAATAAAAW